MQRVGKVQANEKQEKLINAVARWIATDVICAVLKIKYVHLVVLYSNVLKRQHNNMSL